MLNLMNQKSTYEHFVLIVNGEKELFGTIMYCLMIKWEKKFLMFSLKKRLSLSSQLDALQIVLRKNLRKLINSLRN